MFLWNYRFDFVDEDPNAKLYRFGTKFNEKLFFIDPCIGILLSKDSEKSILTEKFRHSNSRLAVTTCSIFPVKVSVEIFTLAAEDYTQKQVSQTLVQTSDSLKISKCATDYDQF